jgi:hypothetical protein
LYLVGLFRVDVDRLEVSCELELICLGLHSTVYPSSFGLRSCFLDSDGPFTFDSRARVRGSGIFIDLTNIFDKFNFRVLLMLEVLSYVLLLGVYY